MSDHIEVLEKMYSAALVESTDRNLTAAERQEAAAQYRALREAINSLRQVPDAKPLADRLQRESECTAEAAHHFYAQGWNACRDAIANPAPPTSGDPLNALADDEAERQQYERDKRDPANCLTEPTPAQAVPSGVYYNDEAGNFYSSTTRQGMGGAFFQTWFARRDDFPKSANTPAQAGAVGNGERWLRSLIGTLDADADTLMLLAAQRITGGAQSGVELPELPEPAGVLVINGQALRGFTADQMREMYRRAYAELARRGG